MSTSKNTEVDQRLPSGEWTGFYIEKVRPDRGWMHLYLEFVDGQIRGEGTDYVGPWNIRGNYDVGTGQCDWVKQYMGKHQVNYAGLAGENGIQGKWSIQGWFDGPFHIWPRERTDLQQMYMQDDLTFSEPTIQLGAIPISPSSSV